MAETYDPQIDPDAQLLPRQPAPRVTRLRKHLRSGAIVSLLGISAAILFFSPDLTSWFHRDRRPRVAGPPIAIPKPLALNSLPNLYAQAAPEEKPPAPPPSPVVPPPETRQARGQRKEITERTGLLPDAAPNLARAMPDFISKASLTADDKQEDINRFVNKGRIVDAPGRYAVMQGTVIPATLMTGINSDMCGPVTAQVSEAVYDTRTGRHLLIPQGSKLVGTYNCEIEYGQRKVEVGWERLIFPSTKSVPFDVEFAAADKEGYAGVPGKVNAHLGRIAFAVLASAILGTTSRFAAGDVSGFRGVSPQQDFALNAARETERAGDRILQRELNVAPTIEARPGTRIVVHVQRDLVLEPYAD